MELGIYKRHVIGRMVNSLHGRHHGKVGYHDHVQVILAE